MRIHESCPAQDWVFLPEIIAFEKNHLLLKKI
jgi:hypothetical protein